MKVNKCLYLLHVAVCSMLITTCVPVFASQPVQNANNAVSDVTPDKGTDITAHIDNFKCIDVIVYKKDTDGAAVAADTSIGGSGIKVTDSYEIEAPLVTGYNFVGWFEADENGNIVTDAQGNAVEAVCRTRRFVIDTATEQDRTQYCYVAQYKALGEVSITVGNSGKPYKINGEEKSDETTVSYKLGTKIKLEATNENFAYWKNESNMVLSRNTVYEFTAAANETVTAVYNNVDVSTNTVIINFESYYGAVVSRQEVSSADEVPAVALPVRIGYDTTGWDYDGDGAYDEEKDTPEAAYNAAKNNGNIITVKAAYVQKETKVRINIVNGTFKDVQGSYIDANISDEIYVIANAAQEGYKFSHWKITGGVDDGKILSYNPQYVFFATKALTVEAVYVEDTVVVEKKGTAQIVESYYDDTEAKAYVVAFLSVPRGCRINKAGFVGTKDASTGADETAFVAGNSNVTVIADATEYENYRYTVRTSNPEWILRPYVNYTDSDGNIVEVYGDIFSVSTLLENQ